MSTPVQLETKFEQKYNFREDKETKTKRESLELLLPNVDEEAVAQYLTSDDKKVRQLVVDSVQANFVNYVRGLVSEDREFSQEKLNKLIEDGKLTLEVIANLEKSARNTVSNDELEAFGKLYFNLSQELLGKSENQATAAVVVISSRVNKIRGNNKALAKVKADFERFLELVDDEVIVEHSGAMTYLTNKIDEFLAAEIDEDSL